MKILFLSLGNICRSPLAKGILKDKLKKRNINIVIESAGFEPYRINERPEKQIVEVAAKHGIDISDNVARLFTSEDFDKFDIIYVMESKSYNEAMYFTRNDDDKKKIKYILSVINGKSKPVPNPYSSGKKGLNEVFDIIDKVCEKIAESLS